MAQARATIEHEVIKQWVEERGGCPAHVKGSGSMNDPGILRIDYPGFKGQHTLEAISWEEFFEAFEDTELAFLYQDEKDSRFSKLVSRDRVDLEASGKHNGRDEDEEVEEYEEYEEEAEEGLDEAYASRAGGPDAIELLSEQHREVEALFEKLESAKSDSQKTRMLVKLANALAAHTKIEETIFYPAAFNEDTEDELREAVEEHLVAKRLLADLLDMEPSHPQFMSKVSVLEEVIRHHVGEEEQVLFVQVREQGEDDLMVLGRRLQKRYRELMEGEPKDELPQETDAAAPLF